MHLDHSHPDFYAEREWPDHIAALRDVLKARLAAAMAVHMRTGDRYPNPEYSEAWGRVAIAQQNLIAALADENRRRGRVAIARMNLPH